MAYDKYTWQTGEVITQEKLNHMEDGIENAYELPAVSDSDNGKVLGVNDGQFGLVSGNGVATGKTLMFDALDSPFLTHKPSSSDKPYVLKPLPISLTEGDQYKYLTRTAFSSEGTDEITTVMTATVSKGRVMMLADVTHLQVTGGNLVDTADGLETFLTWLSSWESADIVALMREVIGEYPSFYLEEKQSTTIRKIHLLQKQD